MGCIPSKPLDSKVLEKLTVIEENIRVLDSHILMIEESVHYIEKNMKKKHRSHRYIDNNISA
jgi:hypothetical protein